MSTTLELGKTEGGEIIHEEDLMSCGCLVQLVEAPGEPKPWRVHHYRCDEHRDI